MKAFRNSKSKFLTPLALVILISLTVVGIAYAFTVGSVEGIWSPVDGGEGAECDRWATGPGDTPTTTWNSWTSQNPPAGDENQVRYGDNQYDNCLSFASQSGFGFDGNNGPVSPSAAQPFYLGKFTHYNNPIFAGNSFNYVDLAITVPVTCPDATVTSFAFSPRFNLHETSNDGTCEYPGTSNCPDRVIVDEATVTETFTCGTTQYAVNILGFTTTGLSGQSCDQSFNAAAVSETYYTEEQTDNHACLWAEIISSKVEVIKKLTATTPGVFDLWIQKGADPAVKFATNVGNNGTTGKQPYDLAGPTSFTVYETAGTATSLANYWKTVACYDRENDALIAETPAFLSVNTLTFTVNPGQDVYCQITNKDIPTAAAIANVSAVVKNSQVELSWESPAPNPLGYLVQRDGVEVGRVAAADENGLFKFVDSSLIAGTYQYAIFEVGSEKEPLAVETVTVTSALKLPIIFK